MRVQSSDQSNAAHGDDASTRGALWEISGVITAILSYPAALFLFYRCGRFAVGATSTATAALGWAGVVLFLLATFSLPALAWVVARRHGAPNRSRVDLFLRRVAHLAFAAPPLYTATGVYLFTLDLPGRDALCWTAGWLLVLPLLLWRGSTLRNDKPVVGLAPPPALRVAHGLMATALILSFLAGHLFNHLTGLWGDATHKAVMDVLRLWYRGTVVQPLLVLGFLFMIASGLTLARYRTTSYTDALGTLQTLSGTYLAAFLFSHLTAVFVLARWKFGTDTDWLWATGAPAGLFADPWNVRLIPHYALAVTAVVTHAACGLRVVLITHGAEKRSADRLAWILAACGAALALVIMSGMLGLRLR